MPTTDAFQATGTGFSIYHEQLRDEVRDQDVRAVRVETRRQSDLLGNLILHETLHVKVQDELGERWMIMSAEVGPWDEDPLGPLCQRLLGALFDRSWETLLHAGDVTGPDWSLSLIHFSASSRLCAPQEISAVRWIDDELCLFHERESEPFARFDREAENTLLLHRLLKQLMENACGSCGEAASLGLGKLLSEVTAVEPSWLTPSRAAVIASVPASVLIYTLPATAAAMGIVVLLLVLLAAMPLLRPAAATLRLYERALVWTRGSEEAVLLLDQVGSLSVVRTAVANEHAELKPQVRFECETSDRRSHIGFRTQVTPANRDRLESIINGTANAIAAMMRVTLQDAGQVDWSDQFTIKPQAIVCQVPSDLLSRSIEQSDVREWNLSDTALRLVLADDSDLSIPTAGCNFYPGLLLLHERGWFKRR
jgi:hypothetical protein